MSAHNVESQTERQTASPARHPNHDEIRRSAFEIHIERAESQDVTLMTGSRPNTNSKILGIRRDTIRRRARELRIQNAKTTGPTALYQPAEHSNELPAMRNWWKGQVVKCRPDGNLRNFCLRVQQKSGNNRDVGTRGRSGYGRNARCPNVWRMGGDLGWLRQRRDPTPSLRLHHQAKLQRRFACPQGPSAVRNRSEALSGNARSRQRRPCASASATWQKHAGRGARHAARRGQGHRQEPIR